MARRRTDTLRFEEVLRLAGRMDALEFLDLDDDRVLPCHVAKNEGMVSAQALHEGAHRFLIGHSAFADMPHIIVEGEMEQEEIVHLPQDRLIEATNHIGHKKARNTQMA